MSASRHPRIETVRLKSIVNQLTDVIYLLCDAKEQDVTVILSQLTNITKEERESLNIVFPDDSRR